MKYSLKKFTIKQQEKLDHDLILEYPSKPNYKYPTYRYSCKPDISMKLIENYEHLEEAMLEWKRKRALNNHSVRLSRKKHNSLIHCEHCHKLILHSKQNKLPSLFTCHDIHQLCESKPLVEMNFDDIHEECIDCLVELHNQEYIDLIITPVDKFDKFENFVNF